ncbi:MAG: hypothetical protein IID33_04740 [Planctomycetes bacterium]|nr:hypothetical protein [Planctomycetota bacterium]
MRLLLGILSWSWIVLGVWWFFRPAGIRRRFERKYRRYARWTLLVIFFVVAGVVFSTGRSIGGFTGTVLIVVAVIALLKGLLFARGKVSDAVLDWWGNQPAVRPLVRSRRAGILAPIPARRAGNPFPWNAGDDRTQDRNPVWIGDEIGILSQHG